MGDALLGGAAVLIWNDVAAEAREQFLNVSVRDDGAVYSLEMCRLSAAFNLQRHGKDHSRPSGAAH